MSVFSRMSLMGILTGIISAMLYYAHSKSEGSTLGIVIGYCMFNLWLVGANIAGEIVKVIKERDGLPK